MASATRRMPGEARKITPRDLASLPAGKWIADPATAEATALEARGATVGAAFYFRFQNAEGKRDRLPLGRFDAEGVTGLTVAQARDEAARLTARIRADGRDLRAMLEADALRARRELEAEAARKAAEEARQQAEADAATAAEARSLGKLCQAYTASLEGRGAKSAAAVALSLRRNLAEPFPVLWNTAADALTVEDLLQPVARLVQAGKLREGAKVRSYLQAAYAAGLRARTDAAAPEALRALRIRSNPARDLATVRGAIRARDRALSAEELRHYFTRLQALADPHRSLLLVHLLTGAQRVEQLARATVDDWDRRAGTLTLRDIKGRRAVPRVHVIPVLPPVAHALAMMRRATVGPFVWTLTGGKGGADYSAAADACERVALAMVEAFETSERFTLGDLRRSVETLLAGFGVPAEVRAQLQSHGLGGLQARHYDRHDYNAEKFEALRLIWATVDPEAEAADRAERERLAKLAAGGTVLAFRRGAA